MFDWNKKGLIEEVKELIAKVENTDDFVMVGEGGEKHPIPTDWLKKEKDFKTTKEYFDYLIHSYGQSYKSGDKEAVEFIRQQMKDVVPRVEFNDDVEEVGSFNKVLDKVFKFLPNKVNYNGNNKYSLQVDKQHQEEYKKTFDKIFDDLAKRYFIKAEFEGDFLQMEYIPKSENKKDDEGRWITIKGNHIFLRDGETPEEGLKRFLKDKEDRDRAFEESKKDGVSKDKEKKDSGSLEGKYEDGSDGFDEEEAIRDIATVKKQGIKSIEEIAEYLGLDEDEVRVLEEKAKSKKTKIDNSILLDAITEVVIESCI